MLGFLKRSEKDRRAMVIDYSAIAKRVEAWVPGKSRVRVSLARRDSMRVLQASFRYRGEPLFAIVFPTEEMARLDQARQTRLIADLFIRAYEDWFATNE